MGLKHHQPPLVCVSPFTLLHPSFQYRPPSLIRFIKLGGFPPACRGRALVCSQDNLTMLALILPAFVFLRFPVCLPTSIVLLVLCRSPFIVSVSARRRLCPSAIFPLLRPCRLPMSLLPPSFRWGEVSSPTLPFFREDPFLEDLFSSAFRLGDRVALLLFLSLRFLSVAS